MARKQAFTKDIDWMLISGQKYMLKKATAHFLQLSSSDTTW